MSEDEYKSKAMRLAHHAFVGGRFSKSTHLGLGDVRVSIAVQDEIMDAIGQLEARIQELEAKCDWKCLGISKEQYNRIQADGIEEFVDWYWGKFGVSLDGSYIDKLREGEDENSES